MALRLQLEALSPRLAGLRCRAVVIHGTDDPLVPYANARFMMAHMPSAELITLRGGNHFLPWNSRAAVEAAIGRAAAVMGSAC